MAKWLTQEWLDEGKKLAEGQPEHPGASVRLQYLVTGGPEGDISYYWILENGKLLESNLGQLDDPEVTLTQNYEDAMRIQKGELDANAALHAGPGQGDRQHGQADGHAPHHELGRVQAATGRHARDHGVLTALAVSVPREPRGLGEASAERRFSRLP